LGKISPIGRLLTLGSFVKITKVDKIFGLLFPPKKARVNFDKKSAGLHLGYFSHLVTLMLNHPWKVSFSSYNLLQIARYRNQCDQIGRIFRHLGDIFRRCAHFFLENNAQMIWAQFFSKISPKIHLNKILIWATFCLKIPKFWTEICLGKSSYLLRLHFGRYFNKIGHIFSLIAI
jgi:hypothetical protein